MRTVLLFLTLLFFAHYATGSYTQAHLSPGSITMTAAGSCPALTVFADGSSVLRAGTYANLYAAIGTTYGSVDGTHFNLPNSQGVFVRGAGSQTIAGVGYVGTQGTSQGDQFQGHLHTFPWQLDNPGGVYGGAGGPQYVNNQAASTSVSLPTNGGYGAPRYGTETRPANISVLYCIWL